MKKELNPVWLESFSWPVEDDEAILEVVVEDHDLTGNDFMGRTSAISVSSCPSHDDVGALFFEFELFRTASRRVRGYAVAAMA